MKKLYLLSLSAIIFFLFASYAFADHQLKKSKEESLVVHKYRMNELRKSFKNEIVEKAKSPKALKDTSKPNEKLKKIIKKSDLLSVLYFNGSEIEVNEISSEKMQDADLMYSMSMAKSYVGYLLGHAVCDGYINSLDDPIDKYLPETKSTLYEGVSLRDMSNMSSGDAYFFQEKGYKKESTKSYALPLLLKRIPIEEFIKKTEKKHQRKQTFFYSNIQTDIVANALDKNLPGGIGKYMHVKISERAGNTEEMVFLRDKNDWAIFFAFLYSSRMDYLKFGKLIYDDWKSNSCISDYLKEVLNKSVSSKQIHKGAYTRYGAFFWTGRNPLKFKHFGLRGHGGQTIIINLDTGAVLSIHSIRQNYDFSKVEKIVLKELIN